MIENKAVKIEPWKTHRCLECDKPIGHQAQRCNECWKDKRKNESSKGSRECRCGSRKSFYSAQCAACHRPGEYKSLSAEEIKEYKKQAARVYTLRKYGLTLEDFEKLGESQQWKCKICAVFGGAALVIDHDHETHKVRGLLCWSCNVALGHFKENIETLYSAQTYLLESVSVL